MARAALLIALSLLAAAPAWAQQEFKEGETPNYSEVIIPELKGLVFVNDPDAVVKEGVFNFKGIQVKGIPMIDKPEFRARMGKFLGKPLTQRSRVEILNEVVYYYRDHGLPFVDVSVLPQDVTYGVLQVLVLQAKAGHVRVTGNKWFSAGALESEIKVKPGEALNVESIADQLDWINRNPFRRVDIVYAKGSEFGSADILLREVDVFPFRAFGSFDDSGTKETQYERLTAGATYGNAFGAGGQLDYQFTTSPNFRSFRAHSGSYSQPLPWHHIVTVFGSYADIKADLPPPFDLTGFSWQTSARYEVPLPGPTLLRHSLTAGFDFKAFDNNLTFGGITAFNTPTQIAQWSLGYGARMRDPFGETSLRVTGYLSPGGWGGHNNDDAFQANRADSKARYHYGKIELNRTNKLPLGLELADLVTLQAADANLQASEQLGFGGFDTIRGYDQRVFNADNGYIISTELRSPAVPLLSSAQKLRWTADGGQLVGFVDYGAGSNHIKLVGEAPETKLLSVGTGVRYNASTHVTFRFDYGWQLLNQAQAARPYASRSHIGLVVRY